MNLKEKLTAIMDKHGSTLFDRAKDFGLSQKSFAEFVNNKYVKQEQHLDTTGFENVIVELDETRGGEGQGDQYFCVLKFTEDGQQVYVCLNAYYSSYNGTDYQSFDFVKQVEVMRTEWAPV